MAHGGSEQALALIQADGDRSWRHMLESGTTITWEAWEMRYKPNQDWNHAWGASPANLLPRFVLGAQPAEPGWATARIRPCPGGLTSASGTIPTPRGPIEIDWQNEDVFRLSITLPEGMTAKLELPSAQDSSGVVANGTPIAATRQGDRWIVTEPVNGSLTLVVQ